MEETKVMIKILSLDYFYWLILIFWLSSYWILKISSAKSLLFTLWLFLIASFIKLLGVNNVAEFVFRLSLIGLIIGVSQAIFELNKKD